MSATRRLAPAEVRAAVSSSAVRAQRHRYGAELHSKRSARAIRDTDLHKLFKAGRVVVFEKADGTRVEHTLTPQDRNKCIVLVGQVKKITGLEPQLVITDKRLAERCQRELGPGWSVATVRRTRRLCAAAGLDVHPVISDPLPAVHRHEEFQGSVWVLDRRRLALVENATVPEAELSRGVVNPDHTPSTTRARKAGLPPESPSRKAAPRAGPPRSEASAAVKAALRELRAEERGRQRAQPTASERSSEGGVHGPTLRLVSALFLERWKVRSDWGDAAALEQAAARAIVLRASEERVAAARSFLATKLLGQQLALEEAAGGSP